LRKISVSWFIETSSSGEHPAEINPAFCPKLNLTIPTREKTIQTHLFIMYNPFLPIVSEENQK
jgi:hypothetical protein